MNSWRRRSLCAAAISFFFVSSTRAQGEISVALVDGEIEITGLPAEALGAPEDVLRVNVAAGSPAILGDYRIENGVLRFRPMFPFDPGREYHVRLEVGGKPVVTTVSLPAHDLAPTTIVTEIYPTTDVLPENQLKLYIHFSAPMAGGDGLRFVKLLDESGQEVVDPFLPLGDAFWDRDHRRYTIFFDPGRVKRGILPNEQMGRPILEGKRYSLVIDAEWRDAQGLSLASSFRKEFTAGVSDEAPIDPKVWKIRAPRSGTREPLVVDFPEPLDRAVLVRTLDVENVDGEIEILRNETRWALTPAKPWRAGSYHLVALSILEDLAGNQIGKRFEVDLFERIDSPDDQQEIYRVPFLIED